ncbi:MAG: prohibitin family protein [Clostridia bacterium]|nr:prohibitin family protein [Clostridia bacterium]
MAWIILSIITCLALYFVLGFKGKVWQKNKKQWIAILGALWIAAGCIATVPTGHTGILVTFGAVEDATYEAGVHFKLPIQEVVVMDNRTQKARLELKCFSSDIQEVTVNYSINYQIEKENAQRIYKTIGTKYYEVVMEPRIHEAVRSVISKYSAENLIESRDQLSVKITEILEKELGAYNIVVVNTAIENLDFSDAFTNAVEEKQVAQQNYLKAQTEQEQKIMEQEASAERDEIAAKAAAEVAKIQAEADAEVMKIQADAAEYAGQRDAAINKALSDTLTEVLIKYYEIQRWDGKLPEYFVSGTDGVLPILGSLPTDGATE